MVPKFHKTRSGFRGAARYLLHDTDADTAERVAWTEVRNVSSRNPDMAWRVMAYTALDQARLKAEAGVPNTGRKSTNCVLHFTLSWHADEAEGLTKAEMLRAANAMLRVMNAQDHQALIVSHRDRPQPHIHILLNRVHPQDGRMLSSSFQKLKASRWAQKYEEERGKIYCAERVINNAARKRGEYTRGRKDKARLVHELAASPANDNDRKQRLLDEHRRQAADLKATERALQSRKVKAWALLEQTYKQLLAALVLKTAQNIARDKTQIRERFRPLWEYHHHEHQAKLRAFEQREAGAIGRMQNALKSIDFASLIGRAKLDDDGRARTIADAFRLLGDAGARLQSLQKQQEAAKRVLETQQRREEEFAITQRKTEQLRDLSDNRSRYEAERSTLILTQGIEQAKLRAQWLEKGRQMREEWRKIRSVEHAPAEAKPSAKENLASEFEAAAMPKSQERSQDTTTLTPTRPAPSRTNSADLLPQEGAQEAAKQIDHWRDRLDRNFDRDFGRERDRDGGRDR